MEGTHRRRAILAGLVASTTLGAVALGSVTLHAATGDPGSVTATPIRHLVVMFQENVSFDHYFGTYPAALDPPGEPGFRAKRGTPAVNGLSRALLTDNPNLANPQRLARRQALTCDQDHDDTPEQLAYDHGLMDQFVQQTGAGLTAQQCTGSSTAPAGVPDDAVMDYYDGNTVTALWNYAQRFAMSDSSYSTGFGPSTPGALNLAGADTSGAVCGTGLSSSDVYPSLPTCAAAQLTATPGRPLPQGSGTVIGDPDPALDVCSGSGRVLMGGRTIGDLLDDGGVTWGWFQGGFSDPAYVPGQPSTDNPARVCTGTHRNIGGTMVKDYSAHHEPFEYYASTANPSHLPPTSVAAIGHRDQANHQYDLKDFWAAAGAGDLPAVSFLKAAKYQDGHAGYSDPLDEQAFLVDTINRLQRLDTWSSTAVVIAYDDSDGWYDHQMGPVLFQSQTPDDALTAPGRCGSNTARVPAGQQARCGYGPRQPLLVLSPWARGNAVDHSLTDQSSITRFVEDNWRLGALDGTYEGRAGTQTDRGHVETLAGTLDGMLDLHNPDGARLFLDPVTGEPNGSS